MRKKVSMSWCHHSMQFICNESVPNLCWQHRVHNSSLQVHSYYLVTDSLHYCDAIMGTVASQITSLAILYTTVYPDADQSKHQSSASLAFVWGIHRGPVNSPHKRPVTRKMFPFDDVIMGKGIWLLTQFHQRSLTDRSVFVSQGHFTLVIYSWRATCSYSWNSCLCYWDRS